jgi:TolB protein
MMLPKRAAHEAPIFRALLLLAWVCQMELAGREPGVELADRMAIRVGVFSGSSGGSARDGLITELGRADCFQLDTSADGAGGSHTVSGESTGGRVTAQLRAPGGGRLFERTYAAPGLDQNLRALADDLVYALTGRPGLATSRITFVSDHSGSPQIYLCEADGGNIMQVTSHRHGAVSPCLTAEADLLAFTSYRTGFPEVMLLDLAGGMERVVTDTPGSNFGAAFSPDGRHLAMVMSFLGNPEIFITDLSTNSAACITESIGVPSSPAWSPDGRRLAFSSDEGEGQQIYIVDFGSEKNPGGVTRFATGFDFATDPAWSPDGESLAFTARSRGGWLVAVKPWPSGKIKVMLRGAQHPSWSPDGRFLIMKRGADLARHQLSSGSTKILISGFGDITEPRWAH